jgi:hypothetical protein
MSSIECLGILDADVDTFEIVAFYKLLRYALMNSTEMDQISK